MSWLGNMKIRSKLTFGFGLLIAIVIVIAGYGIYNLSRQNDNIENLLNYPTARYNNIAMVNAGLNDIRRIVATMTFHLGNTTELNSLYTRARAIHSDTSRLLTENLDSIRTDPSMQEDRRANMISETQNVIDLFYQYYDEVLEGMFIAASMGTVGDEASRQRVTEYFTKGTELNATLQSAFDDLLDGVTTTKNLRTSEIESAANTTILFMLVFAVSAVALGIIITLLISHAVTKPVNEVVDILGHVANGNFAINMKSEVTRDEIGTMTQYVYGLINVIRSMVDDISNLSHSINVDGDIDYRVNTNNYSGSYSEMMQKLNGFTDNYISEVVSILDVLGKVNEGDFTAKIDKLPGKKAFINKTMDDFTSNLFAVEAEVKSMIHAAVEKGNMKFSIDSDRYAGGWRDIMDGLNDIAKAVDAPVSEIMKVMGQLSRGDFSNKVNGNYAGDFSNMQDSVNSTIDKLSDYIAEIADTLTRVSDGDLTINITRDYVGSFVAIKDALNNISKTLNQTMTEITSASGQVLSGAKQIASSSMDLANGASTQASSIEELNASVDLINQQTQANAKNANDANELSQTSTSNAKEGNDAMQQTLSAMNQIKDASNNISKIIKVIQDIAFQTNLLALNAAVEAARAGEHGRGFAVVAEEVRSLAGRSQTAASETTELISHSINTVETGSDIAQSTAATLDTIVDNANKVLNIVSAISSASADQAEAISQVGIGLSQISQVVQSNSAVSEETAAASEELTSQAELLQQLVSYFKL